jgi:hypothetical protein
MQSGLFFQFHRLTGRRLDGRKREPHGKGSLDAAPPTCTIAGDAGLDLFPPDLAFRRGLNKSFGIRIMPLGHRFALVYVVVQCPRTFSKSGKRSNSRRRAHLLTN